VHALTVPCVPFAFPGEAAVEVTLAGGATRDFNLMVRRGKVRGTIDVVHGPSRLEVDDLALLHMARGTAVVDGIACALGDTLTGPRSIELDPETTALLVRINRDDT
jgi:environmental stress-induced protein Ves